MFLVLVKVDYIDERLAAKGIDSWALFLEKANMFLWPEYDGEVWPW